jgi:hypothetical protein
MNPDAPTIATLFGDGIGSDHELQKRRYFKRPRTPYSEKK